MDIDMVRIVTAIMVKEIELCILLHDDHGINEEALALIHEIFPEKRL